MSLADDIAAARKAFSDGVREHAGVSVHKERMEALTDLLWANLDEIVAALRFSPGDLAEARRIAYADGASLRNYASKTSLTTYMRLRLATIADRLQQGPAMPVTAEPGDADKIREIVSRRKLALMGWERATLEAIADRLDTKAKDSAEHAAAVAERVGTAEDPTT